MSEIKDLHHADATPEAVAYLLFELIAEIEGKKSATGTTQDFDRRYILDTFAECMMAVKSPDRRPHRN